MMQPVASVCDRLAIGSDKERLHIVIAAQFCRYTSANRYNVQFA